MVRNLGLERGKEVSLMLGGQEEGGTRGRGGHLWVTLEQSKRLLCNGGLREGVTSYCCSTVKAEVSGQKVLIEPRRLVHWHICKDNSSMFPQFTVKYKTVYIEKPVCL